MIISINNKFSTKQEKQNEKLTTTMWKIWAAKHTFFNGGGDAHFERRGGGGASAETNSKPNQRTT